MLSKLSPALDANAEAVVWIDGTDNGSGELTFTVVDADGVDLVANCTLVILAMVAQLSLKQPLVIVIPLT